MDDYIDLLIEQRWQEVVSGFQNLYHDYGTHVGVAIFVVLVIWFISRIKKQSMLHK